MKLEITIFVLLFLLGSAMAGECPPSDKNCFLCGGVGGTPCTTDCQGHWDATSNSYISCACPQGKPCVCYCPVAAYNPQTEDKCKGVVCANKCEQNTFYVGTCNPADGKCKYVQSEVCKHGCDSTGTRCIETYTPNDDICDYVKGENCAEANNHDCDCQTGWTCKPSDANANEQGCAPSNSVTSNSGTENQKTKTPCASSTFIVAVLAGALLVTTKRK